MQKNSQDLVVPQRVRRKPAQHVTMDDLGGVLGKQCNRCLTLKPLTDYSKNGAKWDSLSEFCRACGVAYNRKNQEAINKKNARFREKHHEVVKERVRTCVRNKRSKMAPGEMAKITREYRAKDPEKWRTYNREYAQKNATQKREHVRKYIRNNRDKINAYMRKRRAENIQFGIASRLRDRLRGILRKKKTPKAASTLELIGCDYETVRAHLESKFTEGMSWEVFLTGAIHIDHIKPLSKFDLTTPEGQKAAMNWKNLQPLWATDNFLKSDRYEE